MPTTLSDALAEAYASAPSDVVVLHTLEIRHPAFTAPIRVVRNTEAITARLEANAPLNPGAMVEFSAFAFELGLPNIDEKATPQLTVQIDNVGREIVEQLELAMEAPAVIWMTYRPFLSTDLGGGPQIDPVWHFAVKEITADVFRVRAVAGFGEFANRQFPAETYTVVRFPGLIA